jgi:hypothetical protein
MTTARLLVAGLTIHAATTATAGAARAQSFGFSFSGSGVVGSITLTYGAATDAKYPAAREITGISGTFSDVNNGLNILNAPILSLVPITRATPEADNLLAPNDFSRFLVASGNEHGSLSYDNLLWLGGSPQTASDYPARGGFLDIYGLMFSIGGGRVVNVWSNGTFGPDPIDYGVAVATASTQLDYLDGGLAAAVVTPEPATLWLVGAGLAGVVVRRRRARGAA